MKKYSIVLLLILTSFLLTAQISIDRTDAYQVGDEIPIIVMQNNQANGVEFNLVIEDNILTGNLDWVNEFIDTVRYLNTEDIDPEQFFEDADFYFLTEEGFAMFVNSEEEYVEIIGIKAYMPFMEGPMNMILSDRLVLMQFPSEYQDTHSDTGLADNRQHISEYQQFIEMAGMDYDQMAENFDSVRIEMKYTLNTEFDEFGSITFTGDYNINGNYEYLREKSRMISRVDILLRSKMGFWISIGSIPGLDLPVEIPMIDTVHNLNYWTKENMYPIAELVMTENHTNIKDVKLRHSPNEKFQIEFTVTNQEDDMVESALISIFGFGQLETDENGKAEIEMKNGNYSYRAEAEEHFEIVNQNFTVDSENKDIIVILEKEENSIESFSFHNINIYPNPASSFMNIENVKSSGIKIFDAGGNLVKEVKNAADFVRIDMSSMAAGIYIVEITNNNYRASGKIIIN